MRPLIITQNITADGSIEMLDDWFDPLAQGPDMHEINRRDSEACEALLLGRRTFEDFRGFWPQQDEDPTGISAELDDLEKFVVTSTLTDPDWRRTRLLHGDPVEAVRELKSRGGPGGRAREIVLTGSIQLCHALIVAGLADEYRLWTFPYVQGRGRRLFPDGHRERLRLLEHSAFSSGVTYTRWSPRKD